VSNDAFKHLATLFDAYCARTHRSKFPVELVGEVSERLRQLNWLLNQVSDLENADHDAVKSFSRAMQSHALLLEIDVKSATTNAPVDFSKVADAYHASMHQRALEIRTLTEAFYYFASRLRDVLREFPLLGNFESKGVRDVRHHLIEHPEKVSKIFQQSIAYGDEFGPRLKVGTPAGSGARFSDNGLYANAEEFAQNLTDKLQNATRILDADDRGGDP
jgi:hypothetical protein